MGDDPATSVVDADCRVHGYDNLFVAGSSVFPTGGYANPTLTIVALDSARRGYPERITRIGAGRASGYRGPTVRSFATRPPRSYSRIRNSAGWEDVWIARAPTHTYKSDRPRWGPQAVSLSPRWTDVRDKSSTAGCSRSRAPFPPSAVAALPICAARRCHVRVLATVVALLARTLIRVGNEEYARTNGSFV